MVDQHQEQLEAESRERTKRIRLDLEVFCFLFTLFMLLIFMFQARKNMELEFSKYKDEFEKRLNAKQEEASQCFPSLHPSTSIKFNMCITAATRGVTGTRQDQRARHGTT